MYLTVIKTIINVYLINDYILMTTYNEFTIFDTELYNKIVETKDLTNVYTAQSTINKQQYKVIEVTENHVVMNPIIGNDIIDDSLVIAK